MNTIVYSKEDYFKVQEAILFLYSTLKNAEDRNKPELTHSLHTGFRLIDYNYPLEIVIAGFLHDVLEEGQNHKDLKNLFGNKVYELILANTKDKRIEDWPKQYDELVKRIATYGEDALTVKAADILDNFFLRRDEIGKEKVAYLAKQIFQYTDSNDRVFGQLRAVFEENI